MWQTFENFSAGRCGWGQRSLLPTNETTHFFQQNERKLIINKLGVINGLGCGLVNKHVAVTDVKIFFEIFQVWSIQYSPVGNNSFSPDSKLYNG